LYSAWLPPLVAIPKNAEAKRALFGCSA